MHIHLKFHYTLPDSFLQIYQISIHHPFIRLPRLQHLGQYWCPSMLLMLSKLLTKKGLLIAVLICISLIITDIDHLFVHILF